MSLTKEQRDALAPEDFAVPAKRKMPIRNTEDDETHTRLAWDMVDRTKGLTDAERSEARSRILKRAKELDIDTKGWHLTASIAFEAVSLNMPKDDDHPNKMPFNGVLTRVDQSSDAPPSGGEGHCTYIPKAVAEAALPSLLGMAVDYKPNLDGHDRRAKIGLITGATIEGDGVHIEGFFYASDFPEETARIQAEKDRLGFSYECQARIQDLDADPWVVGHCVFTGAAVLLKHLAAYQTTSLAAEAEQALENDDMSDEIKKMLEAMGEQLKSVTEQVADIKANGAKAVQATAEHDRVKPHADKLRACAAAMEADGIGTHATKGHANFLRGMAASMEAEAIKGNVPHIYNDHSYFDDRKYEAAADPAVTKKLETLEASVSTIVTAMTDLSAKAFVHAEAPARQTLSPAIQTLLAKGGLDAGNDQLTLTASQADELFDKTGLKGSARIEARLKLREAGVLQPGTRH